MFGAFNIFFYRIDLFTWLVFLTVSSPRTTGEVSLKLTQSQGRFGERTLVFLVHKWIKLHKWVNFMGAEFKLMPQ